MFVSVHRRYKSLRSLILSRMSTPKNECLQLKTLVKTLLKTLLKTLVFPEDFENEEDGVTLKI